MCVRIECATARVVLLGHCTLCNNGAELVCRHVASVTACEHSLSLFGYIAGHPTRHLGPVAVCLDAATQPHRTPEGAHSGARATDDLSCLCGHASWARARFRSMSRGIDLPSSRLLRAEVRCAARTPELCAGKVGDRCHQRRGKPANPESGNRHFAPGSDAAAAGVHCVLPQLPIPIRI